MVDQTAADTSGQAAVGSGIVQIKEVSGSHIEVTIAGERRRVPLEPAVVPVGERVRSPTLLVKARSGIVPFTARAGLADDLEAWLTGPGEFSGLVVGGKGGSGKTRLAVELCQRAREKGWPLAGLLARIADQGALNALITTPVPRLVVIDYAETHAEQLEILLPELVAGATPDAPVRVLLLIRANPKKTSDWARKLRKRSDWLDALLHECETRTLEDEPLNKAERARLFTTAAEAFAKRTDPPLPLPAVPPDAVLAGEAFATPLMVVVAAYLEVHGQQDLPTTRDALFDQILEHEEHHWRATSREVFKEDDPLTRQAAALATLCGAETKTDALETLRLLPELFDANSERIAEIARWAHELYPGLRWWNPMEPDRIGEHLIATTFSDQPEVITGILATDAPEHITWPLTILARAAADHPQTNQTLRSVLTDSLQHLCELAVTQASNTTAGELIYGEATTAASAIENAITTIPVDPGALHGPVDLMPTRPNLILSSLAVTLARQHVQQQQRLAESDPATYEPGLAISLNNFSVDLANQGLREEALQAIRQAVEIRERLAESDPATYESDLAVSLINLSGGLSKAEEHEQALEASQRAVEVFQRLAEANPAVYEPDLAVSLNNLSAFLSEAGEREQALEASRRAVEIRERLAEANPAVYEPDLAKALSNLSSHLSKAGEHEQALKASQRAVEVFQRLAEANPAVYEPDLAISLSNLSSILPDPSDSAQALEASREAVEIRRRLATANPAAYEPDLASSLHNFAVDLANTGVSEQARLAIREAIEIYERLAAANAAAFASQLERSHGLLASLSS